MVRIWIRMLRIPFEWFKFAFKSFESLSNGSNLDSNALNPFRIVLICIRMLRIPFKCLALAFETFLSWLEFGFECIESLSNSSNLH